jgi:hypothetical protein
MADLTGTREADAHWHHPLFHAFISEEIPAIDEFSLRV